MQDDVGALEPFRKFSGANGDYYADVFLKIQKASLPSLHVNPAALVGSFVWAALRGNWLLFTIGFVIDLIAAVNAALFHKYAQAAIDNVNKAYLVERYEGWSGTHLVAAIVVFILGRLLFSWLADRLYVRQYERWRINRAVDSGSDASRLMIAALVFVLVVPLLLYRATQFAPDARSCIKQDRAIARGESVTFKKRFDCFVIGEFPTLFWIDRPDEISYPRGEDGQRIVQRTPPSADAPPVNLNTWTSQSIDDVIGYLTVFLRLSVRRHHELPASDAERHHVGLRGHPLADYHGNPAVRGLAHGRPAGRGVRRRLADLPGSLRVLANGHGHPVSGRGGVDHLRRGRVAARHLGGQVETRPGVRDAHPGRHADDPVLRLPAAGELRSSPSASRPAFSRPSSSPCRRWSA